jgi:hypothetical protein
MQFVIMLLPDGSIHFFRAVRITLRHWRSHPEVCDPARSFLERLAAGRRIASETRLRRIHVQIEELYLVCLEALRQGHRELWQQSISGTPLAELEQGDNEKPDPPGDPTAE